MPEIIDGIYQNAYMPESSIDMANNNNVGGVNKNREVVYVVDWGENRRYGEDARPSDFTPAFQIEYEGNVYRRNLLTWEAALAEGGLGLKYVEDADAGDDKSGEVIVGTIRSTVENSTRGALTGYIEGEFSYILGDYVKAEGDYGNLVVGYNSFVKNSLSNMSQSVGNYNVVDAHPQSGIFGGWNNTIGQYKVQFVVKQRVSAVPDISTNIYHDLFLVTTPFVSGNYSFAVGDLAWWQADGEGGYEFAKAAFALEQFNGPKLFEGQYVYSIDDETYYQLSGGLVVEVSEPSSNFAILNVSGDGAGNITYEISDGTLLSVGERIDVKGTGIYDGKNLEITGISVNDITVEIVGNTETTVVSYGYINTTESVAYDGERSQFNAMIGGFQNSIFGDSTMGSFIAGGSQNKLGSSFVTEYLPVVNEFQTGDIILDEYIILSDAISLDLVGFQVTLSGSNITELPDQSWEVLDIIYNPIDSFNALMTPGDNTLTGVNASLYEVGQKINIIAAPGTLDSNLPAGIYTISEVDEIGNTIKLEGVSALGDGIGTCDIANNAVKLVNTVLTPPVESVTATLTYYEPIINEFSTDNVINDTYIILDTPIDDSYYRGMEVIVVNSDIPELPDGTATVYGIDTTTDTFIPPGINSDALNGVDISLYEVGQQINIVAGTGTLDSNLPAGIYTISEVNQFGFIRIEGLVAAGDGSGTCSISNNAIQVSSFTPLTPGSGQTSKIKFIDLTKARYSPEDGAFVASDSKNLPVQYSSIIASEASIIDFDNLQPSSNARNNSILNSAYSIIHGHGPAWTSINSSLNSEIDTGPRVPSASNGGEGSKLYQINNSIESSIIGAMGYNLAIYNSESSDITLGNNPDGSLAGGPYYRGVSIHDSYNASINNHGFSSIRNSAESSITSQSSGVVPAADTEGYNKIESSLNADIKGYVSFNSIENTYSSKIEGVGRDFAFVQNNVTRNASIKNSQQCEIYMISDYSTIEASTGRGFFDKSYISGVYIPTTQSAESSQYSRIVSSDNVFIDKSGYALIQSSGDSYISEASAFSAIRSSRGGPVDGDAIITGRAFSAIIDGSYASKIKASNSTAINHSIKSTVEDDRFVDYVVGSTAETFAPPLSLALPGFLTGPDFNANTNKSDIYYLIGGDGWGIEYPDSKNKQIAKWNGETDGNGFWEFLTLNPGDYVQYGSGILATFKFDKMAEMDVAQTIPFDASLDVDTLNDRIIFDDINDVDWDIGSEITFTKTDVSDVLPSPLQEGITYKVQLISGQFVSFTDINDIPINITSTGTGIINTTGIARTNGNVWIDFTDASIGVALNFTFNEGNEISTANQSTILRAAYTSIDGGYQNQLADSMYSDIDNGNNNILKNINPSEETNIISYFSPGGDNGIFLRTETANFINIGDEIVITGVVALDNLQQPYPADSELYNGTFVITNVLDNSLVTFFLRETPLYINERVDLTNAKITYRRIGNYNKISNGSYNTMDGYVNYSFLGTGSSNFLGFQSPGNPNEEVEYTSILNGASNIITQASNALIGSGFGNFINTEGVVSKAISGAILNGVFVDITFSEPHELFANQKAVFSGIAIASVDADLYNGYQNIFSVVDEFTVTIILYRVPVGGFPPGTVLTVEPTANATNKVLGKYNTILNAETSFINGLSNWNAILSGTLNELLLVDYGFIGSGLQNRIINSDAVSIVNGKYNTIKDTTTTQWGNVTSPYSSILGGAQNTVLGVGGANIGGGFANTVVDYIAGSQGSAISGGISNTIEGASEPGFIGGGKYNNLGAIPIVSSGYAGNFGFIDEGANSISITQLLRYPFDVAPAVGLPVRFTTNISNQGGPIEYIIYLDGVAASADNVYYIQSFDGTNITFSLDSAESTFDAATNVNVGTDEITLVDASEFVVDMNVSFKGFKDSFGDTTSGSLPTPLVEGQTYKIETINSNVITLKDELGVHIDITAIGSGNVTLYGAGDVADLTTPNGTNGNIKLTYAYDYSDGVFDDISTQFRPTASAIVAGENNTLSGSQSIIGAGLGNIINKAPFAAILTGKTNTITATGELGDVSLIYASLSVIIGGDFNQIVGTSTAIIGNGLSHYIGPDADGQNSSYSAILNGEANAILAGTYSSILNGQYNSIGATIIPEEDVTATGLRTLGSSYNTITGGRYNKIFSSLYSFIGSGMDNYIWTNSSHSAIVSGYENSLMSAGAGFIGAGFQNRIGSIGLGFTGSTILNNTTIQIPYELTTSFNESIIEEGDVVYLVHTGGTASVSIIENYNYIVTSVQENAGNTEIQLGYYDTDYQLINLDIADITDGIYTVNGVEINDHSAIVSGRSNHINSTSSFIGASEESTITAESTFGVIASGFQNVINLSSESFIGSGFGNIITNTSVSSILGGEYNFIGNPFSTVGGQSGGHSSIVGGDYNRIESTGRYQFIGGGFHNTIKSPDAVIVGGVRNTIEETVAGDKSSSASIIGAGNLNLIYGSSGASLLSGTANTIYGEAFDVADSSVILSGKQNLIHKPQGQSIIGISELSLIGALPFTYRLDATDITTGNPGTINDNNAANIVEDQAFVFYGIDDITATSAPENWLIVDGVAVRPGDIYYAVNVTASTYQVALAPAGPAVEIDITGSVDINKQFSTAFPSAVLSYYSSIFSGEKNTITGTFSSVMNGTNNRVEGDRSIIFNGIDNFIGNGTGIASNDDCFILTGKGNVVNAITGANSSGILSGEFNEVIGPNSLIGVGYYCTTNGAGGNTIINGQSCHIGVWERTESTCGTFVLSEISYTPSYCTIISGGDGDITPGCDLRDGFIGGGTGNVIFDGNTSTIITGSGNYMWGDDTNFSIIGAGLSNTIAQAASSGIFTGNENKIGTGSTTQGTSAPSIPVSSVDDTGDTISIPRNYYSEGLLVQGDVITISSDGSLPAPLVSNKPYVVINFTEFSSGVADEIKIQLADSFAGVTGTPVSVNQAYSPIDLTTTGSGNITIDFRTTNFIENASISGGNENITYSGNTTITGGSANFIDYPCLHSEILGGLANIIGVTENGITASENVIINGDGNRILDMGTAAILQGSNNKILGDAAATSSFDTIINGSDNTIDHTASAGGANTIIGSDNVTMTGVSQYNAVISNNANITLNGFTRCIVLGNHTGPFANATTFVENLETSGNANIGGTLSKSAGTFKIDHPVPEKSDTHNLYHSFVESPNAGDNLYTYVASAKTDGETVNIELPDYWNYLNENPRIFIQAKGIFAHAFGKVNGNVLEITCEKSGDYDVLLIGTRKDKAVLKYWKGVEREK